MVEPLSPTVNVSNVDETDGLPNLPQTSLRRQSLDVFGTNNLLQIPNFMGNTQMNRKRNSNQAANEDYAVLGQESFLDISRINSEAGS